MLLPDEFPYRARNNPDKCRNVGLLQPKMVHALPANAEFNPFLCGNFYISQNLAIILEYSDSPSIDKHLNDDLLPLHIIQEVYRIDT